MIPLIGLVVLGLARATSALPDLSGTWVLEATYLEGYLSTAAPGGYSVACTTGPCTSWKLANLTAVNSTSVIIDFDNGVVHAGVVSPGAATLTWAGGSAWVRAAARTRLDVHIVPHSHNDPGWLKTYWTLFNTSTPGVNDFSVRQIYDSVVSALSASPTRTFGAELTVFWSAWWAGANATSRAALRALVASGALEFTGGGWTQNDEAITRFEDIIDQTTLGHSWSASALGAPRATTAWQADPFGHSTTQAAFFAASALDLFTFGRPMSATWGGGGVQPDPVDAASASVWHPTASRPDAGYFDDAAILTHAQRIGYWEPFRTLHPLLVANKIPAAADALAAFIANLAAQRPATETLLIMCGDDFEMGDAAGVVFPGLEAVFAALNARAPGAILPQLDVHFSTPSRFVKALAAEVAAAAAAGAPIAFAPRAADDMLPLIGCEFAAPWTGFYTSRIDFKSLFYAAGAARRAAVTMHALARDAASWAAGFDALLSLWATVSLVQHHDAVTGDSFDNVEEDYKAYVLDGLDRALDASAAAAAALGAPPGSRTCFNASLAPCNTLVTSLAAVGGAATLTIANPSAWARDDYIEVLVPSADVAVTAADGSAVSAQVSLAIDVDAAPAAAYSLTFLAAQLPPLGWRTFVVARVASGAPGVAVLAARWPLAEPAALDNGVIALNFSALGALESIASGDAATPATADLLFYQSRLGTENGCSSLRAAQRRALRAPTAPNPNPITPLSQGTSPRMAFRGPPRRPSPHPVPRRRRSSAGRFSPRSARRSTRARRSAFACTRARRTRASLRAWAPSCLPTFPWTRCSASRRPLRARAPGARTATGSSGTSGAATCGRGGPRPRS